MKMATEKIIPEEKVNMALKSVDPVRKYAPFNGAQNLSHFSNMVESQKVEFDKH